MKTQLNQETRQIFLEELAMTFQQNTKIQSKLDRETIARNLGNMWLEAERKAGAKIQWTNVFEACFDKQNAENNVKKRKTLILLDGEQSPKSLQPFARTSSYYLIALELSKRLLNADASPEQIIRFTVQRLIEGTSLETSQSYEERFNQKFLLDVEKVLRKVTKDLRNNLDLDWLLTMRNKRKLTHPSGEHISWGLFNEGQDENEKPLASVKLGYVSEEVGNGFEAISKLAIPFDPENTLANLRSAITASEFPISFKDGFFQDDDNVVKQTLEVQKGTDFLGLPWTTQTKRNISLELRLDEASRTWNLGINNYFDEKLELLYVDRLHVGEVISPYKFPSGEIVNYKIADVLAYKHSIQFSSFNDSITDENDEQTHDPEFYGIEIVVLHPTGKKQTIWEEWTSSIDGEEFSSFIKAPGYLGFEEAIEQKIVSSNELISGESEYLTSAPSGSIADLILRNITIADSANRIDTLLFERAKKVISHLHNEERKSIAQYEDRLDNYLNGGK
jgi:hypothetical protein